MPTSHAYEERYCAFLDIMGFGQMVERLRSGQMPFQTLKDLLSKIYQPEKGSTISWDTDFRAQSISDAVAISTLVNAVGLIEIFHAIEKLTVELLRQGFFVRGAIVKGMLYHDENMVFGEALVKAYHLERDVVRYPRVMVVREIASDIERYVQQGNRVLQNRMKQSADGPLFLHVLRNVEAAIAAEHTQNITRRPGDSEVLAEYDKLAEQIQQRFDEATDNPRHFEKVKWFAGYWNEAVPFGTKNFRSITGPGLDPKPGTWGE
jgi:hypothetical protein